MHGREGGLEELSTQGAALPSSWDCLSGLEVRQEPSNELLTMLSKAPMIPLQ